MNETKAVAGVKDDRLVEFVPLGCADKIKLSVRIVQNLIAVPTRSGKTCSEQDALKFIMLCSARRMNPFTGDCFLLGFDTQHGPKFEFITAYQALIARAEQHAQFDGMSSGVIVRDGGEKLLELKGDFYLEGQELLGAWGLVKRRDRGIPFEDRLDLKRFQKMNDRGQPMARWGIDPGGMIVKCAEASCLRRAFPTACGDMYLREEISLLGEGVGVLPTPDLAGASPAADQPKGNDDDSNPDLAPSRPTTGTAKPAGESQDSPQAQLGALAQEAGCSFDAYQKWGAESGNDPDAGSRASWSEVPGDLAKRLLRAKGGFVSGLKRFAKEAK